MNADFYRKYKEKNPVKYAAKYGELSPEEVAQKKIGVEPSPEKPVIEKNEVKVEFNTSEDLNTSFASETVEEAPKKTKRTRK